MLLVITLDIAPPSEPREKLARAGKQLCLNICQVAGITIALYFFQIKIVLNGNNKLLIGKKTFSHGKVAKFLLIRIP